MQNIPILEAENAPISPSYSELLAENAALKIANELLTNQVAALTAELELLKHNFAILQRAMFGKKSEKSKKDKPEPEAQEGLGVFNEAEAGAEAEEPEVSVNPKKKTGPKPLPKNLPRKQIIYDIPDSDKTCQCGCQLTKIGEELSEQLDYIPASLQVIEHVRLKYACKACEDTIKTAPVPDRPLPKSNATAGFLAHVIVPKFADHLPLYRQSMILQRQDVEVGRATLCNWLIRCGNLLEPLTMLLKQDIVSSNYVCSDETTLNVLKNEGTSYMWVHMSGNRDRRAIVFDYQASRNGEHATNFLAGFQGAHQADAYAGYNEIHKQKGILGIACWAHARRKFFDITKIVKAPGVAHQMVKIIKRLYNVEREASERELSFEDIKILRQEKAVPVLEKIKQTLDDYKDKVPPQNPLGKAISYTLNNWEGLNAYLNDGCYRIDNNDCENAIRPFAIGRKNWMFSNTERGAKASAILYSLTATCKANNINPYNYMCYVLIAIKPAKSELELRTLLPYNIDRTILKT